MSLEEIKEKEKELLVEIDDLRNSINDEDEENKKRVEEIDYNMKWLIDIDIKEDKSQ